MVKKKNKKPSEAILLNEIELLLAEKRTNFSLFRTGIAVATLPLTVIIFLIATNEYHKVFDNKFYLMLIVLILTLLALGGVFMAIKASRKIKKVDKAVLKIEKDNRRIKNIIV
jgi:archaellum biogenesis protein FlaJ (TadC family)